MTNDLQKTSNENEVLFMSKWLSVELSLLLLVSLVAFGGFVSFYDNGDNALTGEIGFKGSGELPKISNPFSKPNTPKPAPNKIVIGELEFASTSFVGGWAYDPD